MNGVLSSIQTLTSYDPSTQTAGPLNGNATLEAFQNQLQNILGQFTNAGGGIKSLTDLGITAGTDGTYSSNDTTLGNALSGSLASVGNLLGGANGIATQINNLVNNYTQARRLARHHQSGSADQPDAMFPRSRPRSPRKWRPTRRGSRPNTTRWIRRWRS